MATSSRMSGMPRSNSVSSGSQFGAGGLRPIQAESVVTLQDAITSSIRDAILSGTLAPGERLRQDQLSARFEVSRQPIREALTRLQAEGLISRLPQRGLVVRDHTEDEISENYLLRKVLESVAASRAAEQATNDELLRLREIHSRMLRAMNVEARSALVSLNTDFHREVAAAARMPTLNRLLKQLWIGVTILTPQFVPGRARESIAEHERVLVALEAHDPKRAKQAMEDHLDRAAAEYSAWRRSKERTT